MTRKKAQKQDAPAPSVPAWQPSVAQSEGYQRPPRYETFEYKPDPDNPPEHPLWVTVQTNLSFRELNAIPYGPGTPYTALMATTARYVVDWNARALNLDSGEWEIVPPPATAGPDIYLVLSTDEAEWIFSKVKTGYQGGDDRKKDLPTPKPSEPPGPSGDEPPLTIAPPPNLHRYLEWNLEPLRPWEWWEVDAQEWTEATGLVKAFRKAVAEEERKATERQRTIAEQESAMKKKTEARAGKMNR